MQRKNEVINNIVKWNTCESYTNFRLQCVYRIVTY